MTNKLKRFFKLSKKEESNPLLVEIDRLNNKVNELQDIIFHKAQANTVIVDWTKINAFSVERTLDENNIPLTLIGIIDIEGKIDEWNLYCDDIQHERLAEEFKEYKENIIDK